MRYYLVEGGGGFDLLLTEERAPLSKPTCSLGKFSAHRQPPASGACTPPPSPLLEVPPTLRELAWPRADPAPKGGGEAIAGDNHGRTGDGAR